ncbi:MAG: DGQHR domain-containing protein, partial [Planctomycetota bacterium]
MSNSRVLGWIETNRTYVAALTPPTARDLLFVSTYDQEDPESNAVNKHGYQRPPTQKRFKEIGDYFARDNNRFKITPLVVSVRLHDDSEIELFIQMLDAGDIGGLRKRFGDKVASTVDGQHRMNGLITAWESDHDFLPQIPVMLFFKLSFAEEADLFNVINVTQRKLPKALIETTRGDIVDRDSTSYAQQVRRIAFSLCRDDDSVWGPIDGIEQINMTGVRDPNRPVTYEGLRRSTSNMFPKPL